MTSPSSPAGLAGLVLAGGSSRRFGSDKALAVVEGVTLLDVAVATLREACDGPVLVASGDGTSRPGVGDGEVADLVADAGPLSAIAGGLAALAEEAPAVAVLAVDHLAPSAPLLRLLAARRGDAACALVEVRGRWQPLHAVWATAVAEAAAAAVDAGERSPSAWLRTRDVVVVAEDDVRDVGLDPDATRDVDRPEDLRGSDAGHEAGGGR